MKKLLAVFGLYLILCVQSSLQIGKEKVPPFRPPKDAKIDEMFGNKIIEKRGVGFGKTKIPPFVPDEGVKINGHLGKHLEKRDAPSDADELPLLMKTLRLRPGSGDNINEIIENYIKSHKGQDSQGPVEGGKPAGDDEPRLLGEPLIGSNRHPPVKGDKPNTDDEGILNSIKKIGRGWGRFFGGKKPIENSEPEGDEPRLLGEPMIGSNRHPPVKDGEKPVDGGRPKRSADADDSVAEPELPGKNMIGKNRHPSGKSHPGEERPKRSVDELKPIEKEEMDLPALLKTLRLRPGSNEYNKIVDDFIKNRKGDGVSDGNVKDEPKHEGDADGDVDDGPIGRKLISAFHIPPFRPGKDHNKPVTECKDEDREQVLQCFTEYFKNFDIEVVDGKLPSMFEIYGKMKKCKDYEKQQKYFQDFAACYKSTPETCFHAAELSKITQQPEEADYLATFFTISEFSFKSKHNKKVAKCFIGKVVEASKHKYTNFKECETVKEILLEAISNFKVDCAKTEPQDGDLKSLLQPFLRRTSLGSNCPSLLSDINV